MNKRDLVSQVARRTGVPPATVAAVVEEILAVVRDTVARGQRVVLAGFGTFERVRRNARVGRNPRTREPVKIPARTVAAFRPGTAFRAAVAAPRRKTTKRAARRPLPRR